MRLIDADALNNSMYHEAFETDSELQKWDSGCWIRYKMFENHLDNVPIIDAMPVVHGEWIAVDPLNMERPYNWVCSNCGGGCVDYRTTYCHDCGAKMEVQNE